MADQLRWIETTGGPHILAAAEIVAFWQGTDGWAGNSPDDDSDYAKACRRGDQWLNVMPAQGGQVIVFGGDVGPIAWLPDPDRRGGAFVQWIACVDEASILQLLRSPVPINRRTLPEPELIEFDTNSSGTLKLFDASLKGDEIGVDCTELNILPGRYRLTASLIETDDVVVVVRELKSALC